MTVQVGNDTVCVMVSSGPGRLGGFGTGSSLLLGVLCMLVRAGKSCRYCDTP
jgi:hypothetical protein